MKLPQILILSAAFLIMVSSAFTLIATTDRTPVYINVVTIGILMIAMLVIIIKDKKDKKIE